MPIVVAPDTDRRHSEQARLRELRRRGCHAFVVDRDVEIALVREPEGGAEIDLERLGGGIGRLGRC